MNYFDLLNAFYELLKVNPPSSNAQLLYHTLLMEYNRANWQSERIQRTNTYICGLCGLNEKALIKAKNELKLLGLIDFKTAKKKATIYVLTAFLTVKSTVKTAVKEQSKRELKSSLNGSQNGSHIKTKEKEKDIEKDIEKEKRFISDVIDYLNKSAGTAYRANSQDTIKCITARLKEGFVFEDFKKAIDNKVAEWKGTDMQTYLRPQTLFGSKFESYVNSARSTATGYASNRKTNHTDIEALMHREND